MDIEYIITSFFKSREKNKDEGVLTIHPIFNEIQMIKMLKINSLNISDPSKKKMISSYLETQMDILNKLALNLVNNYDLFVGDVNSLRLEILKSLNETYAVSKGNGIPQIFIDKISLFNIRYIEIVLDLSVDIANSHLDISNRDKMFSILNILIFYIKVIMSNVEQIINEMNGELQSALIGSLFDT